jgi:hypothetical protein
MIETKNLRSSWKTLPFLWSRNMNFVFRKNNLTTSFLLKTLVNSSSFIYLDKYCHNLNIWVQILSISKDSLISRNNVYCKNGSFTLY